MRSRGSRSAIIAVLLLGALIFGGVYYAWNTASDIFQPVAPDGSGKTIRIVIQPGETTAQIADDLETKGLIRNALAFRVWARIRDLDTHLQAGGYTKLNSSMTISQIIDQLLIGQPDELPGVTIPEGWRIEQIAQKIATIGLVKFNVKDFLKYTKNPTQFPDAAKYPILKSIPEGSSMEGLLFPDTYWFPIDADARQVVNMMLTEFTNVVQQHQLGAQAQAHNLSLDQMIILASLVERESRFDQDRPLVASVYWNRVLKPNDETVGLLQADPTVQYARDSQPGTTKYWAPLQTTDPNTTPDSPWNTYKYKGWPPTPICSPGLLSLQAAAAPAKTDYYFFYARKSDLHNVYAKTHAEFLQDQQKYPPSN